MNRHNYGIKAGVFGLIINIFLGVIKLIVGLLSNSISIMADSVNNFIDSISSIFTIIGFNLSNKKPSKTHPYGYARYEYVTGLFVALFMFLMGTLFLKESIVKIFSKDKLNITLITYIILSVSILLKIILINVYLNLYKKINSDALKTNVIDTRNDIISTSSILISIVIMKIYNINIDGYLGVIISSFIIYSSIKMIQEVLKPIIGTKPDEDMVKVIKKKLLSYKYVLGIHDLVIHNYGVNNDFITVHIELDSKLSLIDAHDLADNIERDFKDDGYILTIHVDPIVVGNKKMDELKKNIIKSLKIFDKELSIHDFRVVDGNDTKVLFDCVVPFDKNYTEDEIIKHLNKTINKKLTYMIEIDRPFC